MEDKYCTNCGAEINENTKFCKECGHSIDSELENNQNNNKNKQKSFKDKTLDFLEPTLEPSRKTTSSNSTRENNLKNKILSDSRKNHEQIVVNISEKSLDSLVNKLTWRFLLILCILNILSLFLIGTML